MPFKVEVGPPQIAIHHAQTVLITDRTARWTGRPTRASTSSTPG